MQITFIVAQRMCWALFAGSAKKITKIERKRSYMIHGYSYLHFKHKQTNGTS